MDPISIALGGLGLLSSVAGGFGNPYKGYDKQAEGLEGYAKRLDNPNDRFYADQRKQYSNSLLDILMANQIKQQKELERRGIESNAINSEMYRDNQRMASEETNKYQTELFREGQQLKQNYMGQAQQMRGLYAQGKQAQMDTIGSFGNQLIGLGGGLYMDNLARKESASQWNDQINFQNKVLDKLGNTNPMGNKPHNGLPAYSPVKQKSYNVNRNLGSFGLLGYLPER